MKNHKIIQSAISLTLQSWKIARLLLLLLVTTNTANSQGVRSAHNCLPENQNWEVTQGSDAQGCYYEVKFKPIWSAGGGNMMLNPHGLYIQIDGATITSTVIMPTSGPWLTASTTSRSFQFTNWVYWNAPLNNPIPSGSLLHVKVYVSQGNTICKGNTPPIKVHLRELGGASWQPYGTSTPNSWMPYPTPSQSDWRDPTKIFHQVWNCDSLFKFTCNPKNYSIGNDTTICIPPPQFLTLNLTGAPTPLPAMVKWYAAPCAPLPVSLPPAAPWTLVQNGGLTHNTNGVNTCKYYIAVINNGCYTYYSNRKKIDICNAPSGNITASPALQSPPSLPPNRACAFYQGTLTVSFSASQCPPTIQWYKKLGTWTPINGATSAAYAIPTPLVADENCFTKYDYRATLTNKCGTATIDFPIYIDRIPWGGKVTTETDNFWDRGTGTMDAPELCYGMGTKLKDSITCGKVKRWEVRNATPLNPPQPCPYTWGALFTPIAGSATSIYWTNNLYSTKQYYAYVENGACNAVPNLGQSNTIIVKVKPKISTQISSTSTVICNNNSVNISSSTNYGACGFGGLTYQWYKDGEIMPGETNANHAAKTCGNYTMKVYDNACGDS